MEKAVEAPTPGTPEHDAAMAAKVDENAQKATLAASGDKPVEPQPETPEKAPEESGKDDKEQAKDALTDAGIDYTAMQSEYDEKGALSDDTYEKLAKVGFPKEVVDGFIAGQKALAEAREMRGQMVAGGAEELSKLQSWAASGGMSAEEITAYNKAVEGSEEDMLGAIKGLKSKYEAQYGSPPSLLGGTTGTPQAQGYASRAEMTKDMRDPRYAKDPAFRAKVEAKLLKTTSF